MEKRARKTGKISSEEFEKLTLAEKFRYIRDKREEIHRRMRRLIYFKAEE